MKEYYLLLKMDKAVPNIDLRELYSHFSSNEGKV